MDEKLPQTKDETPQMEAAVPADAIAGAELAANDPLKDTLVAALKTVFDPEIPVDIYELGLIYRLDIDLERNVEVDMTLTAPGCGLTSTVWWGG